MAIVVAYVKTPTGFLPRHPSSVVTGDRFYLVTDGKRGPVQTASAMPYRISHEGDNDGDWVIPAREEQQA